MFLFYFVIFVCLPHNPFSLEKNLTSTTEIYCLGLNKQTNNDNIIALNIYMYCL